MLKMATYPGMNLGGEVRESVSLDEDDLSDVEDEVFIRDGKNSYKLAEELNVKRPLMAPRRKLGKPEITSRLKTRLPCRVFCRPCCYFIAALSVLIGFIAVIVVLVSIFPLPLSKLRAWMITRALPRPKNATKSLPCDNLRVSDVWVNDLPILTTDSPVRLVDVDRDGVADIVFGFGTGPNYDRLPPAVFCPVFLGVGEPCKGGVIALNGSSGALLWRHWANDTIFDVHCSSDLNGDSRADCLANGVAGTLLAIDARNGSLIWARYGDKMDVFVANMAPDLDGDGIDEVLASHTSLRDSRGHLILMSGRTGQEIRRLETPQAARTFFMPQVLRANATNFFIYGTGGTSTPGGLGVARFEVFDKGNWSSKALYEDRFKGVLTQSVLIDITGDGILDIVTAMYNSTVVAIDGANFTQIWNFTIPNSETNTTPTPAFFNSDEIPDFLVTYQKFDNIVNYNYTETYILDGRDGRPIYEKSIGNSVYTQMGGLALTMDTPESDFFLFWTRECTNIDMYNKNGQVRNSASEQNGDLCRMMFNTSSILRLNALNQFDQPPGLEIYNSANRIGIEFNNTKSPMKLLRDYLKHSKLPIFSEGEAEIDEPYVDEQKINEKIKVHKYGTSNFRHKDNPGQGIVKDYPNRPIEQLETKFEPDLYQTNILPNDMDPYNDEIYDQKQEMYTPEQNSRNPRSRKPENSKQTSSKKKSLGDNPASGGIYSYNNVKSARKQLFYDLNSVPTEILTDAYLKNREKHSKFEQRDVGSHTGKISDHLVGIGDEEKSGFTLWDLESEKEVQENGGDRVKRQLHFSEGVVRRVSSVGAVTDAFNTTDNAIDLVFITYWQPLASNDDDLNECVEEKIANESEEEIHAYQKITEDEKRRLFTNECEKEAQDLQSNFRYFEQIPKLRLGQMTVYRVRIQCLCNEADGKSGKCAKFQRGADQKWPMYLGRNGNGVFGI